MEEHSSLREFVNFDPAIGRLDVLYYERMHNVQKYCKLWEVCNMLLVLSYGQASVERGFSTNRQIEIGNMHNETYVSQRVICDHVNSVGGLENIAIDKAMMLSVAGARQKYMMFLDEQKHSKAMIAVGKKRKNILAEIEELKRAKKRLETEANALQTDADELALKAESSGKLLLVAKSNSNRQSTKEKFLKMNELDDQLNNKLVEFKKQ